MGTCLPKAGNSLDLDKVVFFCCRISVLSDKVKVEVLRFNIGFLSTLLENRKYALSLIPLMESSRDINAG